MGRLKIVDARSMTRPSRASDVNIIHKAGDRLAKEKKAVEPSLGKSSPTTIGPGYKI